MTDFRLDNYVSRNDIANALVDNEEQCMWVLMQLAQNLDASDMVEHLHVGDADALEVAKWFEDMAECIRADVEADNP